MSPKAISLLHSCKKEKKRFCVTKQSTVQSTVQSKKQSTVQTAIQLNDTYIYGVGILAVLAIRVCLFLHITLPRLQIKNKSMKNNSNHQKDVICFRSDDEKNIYSK